MRIEGTRLFRIVRNVTMETGTAWPNSAVLDTQWGTGTVQLSLTMLQESELKRFVCGVCVDHHFVDHIECGYGIDIKIFYPSLDRSFVFRGRSELTN